MATLFGMDCKRITTMFLVMIWSRFSTCVITDVQLVGGPDSNKGTIEIKIDNGTWETVCGTSIHITDVIVICRQLGFEGANIALQKTPYAYGHNSSPNHGLSCAENNMDISQCTLDTQTGCSNSSGAASCHGEGYLGCFVSKRGTDRVLTGKSNISTLMSISYCIKFCESTTEDYAYAGVEDSDECYCGKAGDNYTRYGVRSDKSCQFPCTGDSTDSCGAAGFTAIFKVISPPPTSSEVDSTNQTTTTSNKIVLSTSSSSSSFLSTLEPQGTLSIPVVGNSTGLYAGIGGGVAAVVIIIIIIIAIACISKTRSQQRTKGIASSQRTTLTTASRRPAYDEINDFGITNGAEASSARSFQPGAQTHSNASSSRGEKNVLLVNMNPRKSSNIYEGTMDETPDGEPTQNPSRGTTAIPQNSNDRLSVLYAIPDKMANGAEDGYDEINLGIAPYSSFENPRQPTATTKKTDRMSVVYAASDKNRERNGASEDMDSLYAMPDKNGNQNNPSDDTSEDVGSLYAMPDKSRGKPDGYDGDQDLYAKSNQDLYAKTNDSFSGDQYDEMEMVDNELYTM